MNLTNLPIQSAPSRTATDIKRVYSAGQQVAGGKGTVQERRAALRMASKEFEAIFIQQMISAMRKTVSDGGLIKENIGEKIFEGMLDEEWSKKLASRGGQTSLGELLYRQMSRHTGLEEKPEFGQSADSAKSEFKEFTDGATRAIQLPKSAGFRDLMKRNSSADGPPPAAAQQFGTRGGK